jgi:hypothetical protein
MSERTLTHKGHSIVINDDPGAVGVTIDGQQVHVFGSEADYWTPLQAYQRFASLDELARAVAEISRPPE